MDSTDSNSIDILKKELPLIPKSPGVYRMLNHKDDILYVGKAKNLPNRLKSYVAEKNHIIRTERMLSQTFNFQQLISPQNDVFRYEYQLLGVIFCTFSCFSSVFCKLL